MYLNVPKVARAITGTAAIATRNMANDTREKTVGFIMGNRKSPDNPFPKNIVNKSTGKYYANSVARKWPKSPKSYVKPKNPISLAQVMYEKSDKRTERVGMYSIPMRSYRVGPVGGGAVMAGGSVPLLLEKGGTTSAFYREVKKNGKTVRWEFRRHKPKAPNSSQAQNVGRPKGKPVRYGSWSEVNAVRRARGQQVGGRRSSSAPSPDADAAFVAQGWKGPKTFSVRPRPYISKAWDKVRARGDRYISKASRHFPASYRAGTYLRVAA